MRKKEDRRAGLVGRLPYALRRPGLYGKPATAFMSCSTPGSPHFEWSLDATAHVSPDCLARALEIMERAWPEGEGHMAKLAINALIGLWARSKDVFYSTRTLNHEVDGRGRSSSTTGASATTTTSTPRSSSPTAPCGFGVRGASTGPCERCRLATWWR